MRTSSMRFYSNIKAKLMKEPIFLVMGEFLDVSYSQKIVRIMKVLVPGSYHFPMRSMACK